MAPSLSHSDIASGFWTDHSSGTLYLLVQDRTAVALSNIIAIALTLSLARLLVFVKIGASYVHGIISKLRSSNEVQDLSPSSSSRPSDRGSAAISLQPLPSAQPGPQGRARTTTIVIDIEQATSEQDAAARILRSTWQDYVCMGRVRLNKSQSSAIEEALKKFSDFVQNVRDHWLKIVGGLGESLLFFSLFVGYQVIAIVCANQILGPSTARSASTRAGFWFPDVLDAEHMVNTSIIPPIHDYYTDMTFKSIAYAQNCYKNDARPEECSLFATSVLPFQKIHNATCPFSSDMCLHGPHSAFEMTTGFLDTKLLGINEKHTCEFQFRKVCAPLRTDEPYVISRRMGYTSNHRVEYYYGDGWGTIQQGNLSFVEAVGDPTAYTQGRPRYSIVEIGTDALRPIGSKPAREWRSELRVRDSKVSLYFIRPVDLVYSAPSTDPIFPATVPAQTMESGDTLYATPHQRSTVLACADSIQIRHPVSGHIWHPRYQNVSQLDDANWQYPRVHPSIHMVNMTYLASETFESRYEGMAEHFDAPRRIRRLFSSPLHEEQWKLEVNKMFVTKLALLQFHALSMAQGEVSTLPRARNLLEEYGVNAKGKILFVAAGWRNIKVNVLIGALLLCISVFAITQRDGNEVRSIRLVRTIILPILQEAWKELNDVDIYKFGRYFEEGKKSFLSCFR